MDIAKDLSSTLDLDTLLNSITQAAADVTNAKDASILLYDEGNDDLYFQASTNLDSRLMIGLRVPVDGSIAGAIVTKKKPVIVGNVKDDPRHYDDISKVSKYKTESLLGIPLITKNKVIGVLEVLNKRDGVFTLVDQDLLTALGSQAAVAIENARFFLQADLIAEMVHELRTPLAGINTASHLLMRPEVSEMQRANLVEMILKETNRLSEMTTSFLDLARLESGRSPMKVDQVDLTQLLSEVHDIMSGRIEEQGLELEWDVPDDLPHFQGDVDKIKQVALNLVSNAIKYNRPGGKIQVGSSSGKNKISFWVSDEGPGISSKHIDSLFHKFFRIPGSDQYTKGTGLGLSIVKKIVDSHQGSIEVDSEVGKGSTFRVTLPVGMKN